MEIPTFHIAIENQVHAAAIKYAFQLLFEPFAIKIEYISFNSPIPANAVVISYGKHTRKIDTKFHLFIQESLFFDKYTRSKYLPTLSYSKRLGVPILYSPGELVFNKKENALYINQDIVASAFYWASRYEEVCIEERDEHNRFKLENTLSSQHNVFHIPVIDEYCSMLKNWFIISGIHVTYKKRYQDCDFVICPTHDIDQVTRGRLECLYHEIKSIKQGQLNKLSNFWNIIYNGIFGKDLYWNFNDILELEKRHNAASTFYFMTNTGSELHVDYKFTGRSFKPVIRNIYKNNSQIGLHGSYHSVIDNNLLESEKAYIEKAVKRPISSIRQHFLRFDIRDMWSKQEQAGFAIDTSLGFGDKPGFRAGIARPFQPFNFMAQKPYNILEIPMIIMDGSFRHYDAKTPEKAWDDILPVLEAVKKHRGMASILWHNTFFVEYTKYEGFRELYEHILDWVNRNNGRNMSIEQGAQYWSNVQV